MVNRATQWVAVMVVVMAVVVAQNGRLSMALDMDDVVKRAEEAKNWAKSKISGKWSISKVKESTGNVAYKTVGKGGSEKAKDGGKGLHVSDKDEEMPEGVMTKKACHEAAPKNNLHTFMKDEAAGVEGATEGPPQEAAQQDQPEPNEAVAETTKEGASEATPETASQVGTSTGTGIADALKQAAGVSKDAMQKVGEASAPPGTLSEAQDQATSGAAATGAEDKPLPETSGATENETQYSSTRTQGLDDSSISVNDDTVIELEDDTT